MDRIRGQFLTTLFAPAINRAEYKGIFAPLSADRIFIDDCKQRVNNAYATDHELKDGYSRLAFLLWLNDDRAESFLLWEKDIELKRIGWWQYLRYADAVLERDGLAAAEPLYMHIHRNYPEAKNILASLGWSLRDVDINKAVELALTDERDDRMTPGFKLNLAVLLAMQCKPDEVLRHVESAYADDVTLKDGYARVGWQYFWPKKEYDHTIRWLEMDKRLGRLSPAQFVNLARVYAARGDFEASVDLVKEVYAANPDLKDGYARTAWAAYGSDPAERLKALPWLEKDYAENRLSPSHMLNLAFLRAQRGDLDAASGLVEEAYRQNDTLKDGYARIGWTAFASKPDERIKAYPYLEKDYGVGRLSPGHMLNLALLHAQKGDLDAASRLVEEAYRHNDTTKDGYSRIAVARRLLSIDRESELEYFKRDEAMNRLSPRMRLEMASTYARTGDMCFAEKNVKLSYAEDPTLADGYTRIAWLCCKPRLMYDVALSLIQKDHELGKLSPDGELKMAVLLALTGDHAAGQRMIDDVYRQFPKAQNGYCLLAWEVYLRCGDLSKTLELFEMDRRSERISDEWLGRFDVIKGLEKRRG